MKKKQFKNTNSFTYINNHPCSFSQHIIPSHIQHNKIVTKISMNLLAKQSAAVTPIKPKNGADVGQVSYDTVAIFDQQFRMTTKKVWNLVSKKMGNHDTKNEPLTITFPATFLGRFRKFFLPMMAERAFAVLCFLAQPHFGVCIVKLCSVHTLYTQRFITSQHILRQSSTNSAVSTGFVLLNSLENRQEFCVIPIKNTTTNNHGE